MAALAPRLLVRISGRRKQCVVEIRTAGISAQQLSKGIGGSRPSCRNGAEPRKKPVVMCDFRAASPCAPAHIQFLQYRPLMVADAVCGNRDRGTTGVAAPPTPPGMRVRTGRFEKLRS
jgi:hypothetical protein